jgi:hypothetical protein
MMINTLQHFSYNYNSYTFEKSIVNNFTKDEVIQMCKEYHPTLWDNFMVQIEKEKIALNKLLEKLEGSTFIIIDECHNLSHANITDTHNEINKLLQKINDLETKNKLLQNDLKLEKFPDGAIVYVIEDIDVDKQIFYRIGIL